uniref:Uncharacterized protein n=1 Tax=Ananas comosus var. bracteatus TaxID=296719 RepID=A0A6V7QHB1_ANACO|nr:unnamed protein product [Ananas comosus var. bracteatus]
MVDDPATDAVVLWGNGNNSFVVWDPPSSRGIYSPSTSSTSTSPASFANLIPTMEKSHNLSMCLSEAAKSGKVVLEAAVLTYVVVVGLTLYTFWAAKRGYDFNFLGPFLSAALVLIIYCLIQVAAKRAACNVL